MKRTFFILLNLILISNFSISQTNWKAKLNLIEFDSLIHNRIYEIGVDDYQLVQLIEFKNGDFRGTLNHSVWKSNRDEEKVEQIVEKVNISESIAKTLMTNLINNNFENIPICDEENGCIDGLDGTTTYFNVKTSEIEKKQSYWELESDYYYKEPNIPNSIRQSRKILDVINEQFDLEKQFENYLSRLPLGTYIYSSMIIGMK